MLVVRPARPDDSDAFLELARLSGPGFTSLPEEEAILAARLKTSVASFGASIEGPGEESYVLILEDLSSRRVMGCAAVKASVGLAKPFFNFKVFRIAQASNAVERRFDLDVMVLVNEFAGCTEVGTLFVRPEARGGGAGRLVAQSRYLLIAAAPQRFAATVIAELRGVVDKDGYSPFWEHLGAKFFRMPFEEADYLSAVTDNQFIVDLMPKFPIYLDLLPEPARAVVGKPHADGEGAMRLLEWEGFRYERVVDIFDGGPLVSAPRDHIRTLRDSRRVTVQGVDAPANARAAIVSTDDLARFATCFARVELHGDVARVERAAMQALGLRDGEPARIWVRS